MSGYDFYIFFLSLTVFLLLTSLFGVMLYIVIKQERKLVKGGLEDEKIKIEYLKESKTNPAVKIVCAVFTWLVLVVLIVVVAFSLYVQLSGNEVKGDVPVPKVVMSGSMSYKSQVNEYLEENSIDDQFQMFDLIFIEKLPDEFELELYDVVLYEYEGILIIHRIIDIEEPNEKHPDHRHFLLRGDANKYSDEFPVLYEQMRAVYRGQRVPFIGSFFAFLQSPTGYLCILLLLFAVIATPILEKKIWEEKLARLREIGFIPVEVTLDTATDTETDTAEAEARDEAEEDQHD